MTPYLVAWMERGPIKWDRGAMLGEKIDSVSNIMCLRYLWDIQREIAKGSFDIQSWALREYKESFGSVNI